MTTQVSVPNEVVPALSLLDKTVIGAVLIIVLTLCIISIVTLIKVQNARVSDQKSLNEKSEALMSKMLMAFTEMKGALESLKGSHDALKNAEQETQRVLSAQQQAFNLLLISRQKEEEPPRKRG